jgi:hypothetical protein
MRTAGATVSSTVIVVDGIGQPVANAVVTGMWSGVVLGSFVTAITNGSGRAIFVSPHLTFHGPVQFSVMIVSKAGVVYDIGRNVKSSASIFY